MKKPVVLFVDDERNILSAYKRLFMDEPYELLFANSASEGLKVLNSRRPHIIISDLRMPEMNGIDFFTEVRTINPDTLRIMISASSEKENVIKAIGSGQVWKYILKPWNDEELIALVKEGVIKFFREFNLIIKDKALTAKNKIFFLCPPEEITDNLLIEFIHRGYECCSLDDPNHAELMLAKYENSILFINLDHKLKDFSWDKYIMGIMANDKIKNGKIGVCSITPDLSVHDKYAKKLKVPLGFIQIRKIASQTRDSFLKVLDTLSGGDRRQSVRVMISNQEDGIVNLKYSRQIYTGNIIHISPEAMACTFRDPPQIEIDEVIDNMQLKLKGVPVLTAGELKIKKIQNGQILFVVLFHHGKSQDAEQKICKFIGKALKEKIDFDICNELVLEKQGKE